MKAPAFVEVVQGNPKFPWKYLTQQYLVLGLGVHERSACFLHHYDRLNRTLPDRSLRQFLYWSIGLFEGRLGEHLFALVLGLSRECDKEGEASLALQIDGENFYTLSFTIVPGSVTGSRFAEVVLISRLQATETAKDCPTKTIRSMRRAIHGLDFGSYLLAAMQGIAAALGIEEIACVPSRKNISYDEKHAVRFRVAYEDVFAKLGIRAGQDGWMALPVSLREREPEAYDRPQNMKMMAQQRIKDSVRGACNRRMAKIVGQGPSGEPLKRNQHSIEDSSKLFDREETLSLVP